MKKFQASVVFVAFVLTAICTPIATQAQQVSEKELKQAFAPKGTHRAPFKKASEVALTSVNLQFKLATRQEQMKRKVGNVVTWGFLDGIDDAMFQEIADEYYQRLATKFKENGFSLNESYKDHKSYRKLVDDNADRDRETEKKYWGVAKIVTANNAPYIEYPTGMMGAHASLGNDLKIPVGQLFITIDFLDITQNIKAGVKDRWGDYFSKFQTDVRPVIRIEGITATSMSKQFKGEGTYAQFTGGNWSFCNAKFQHGFVLASDKDYAKDVASEKGIPEKYQNRVASEVVSILSMGRARGGGKGNLEATFTIQADPQAYKEAVLNALDKYNDYLLAYIKANN